MSKTTTGYRSAFDILDLGRHSGHRQVGHDILSAMYTGFTIGGVEGAKAGLLHVYLDSLSDRWKKMMGSASGRDMLEAAMLYNAY